MHRLPPGQGTSTFWKSSKSVPALGNPQAQFLPTLAGPGANLTPKKSKKRVSGWSTKSFEVATFCTCRFTPRLSYLNLHISFPHQLITRRPIHPPEERAFRLLELDNDCESSFDVLFSHRPVVLFLIRYPLPFSFSPFFESVQPSPLMPRSTFLS